VSDIAIESPLEAARASRRVSGTPCGSSARACSQLLLQIRGAYNRMRQLDAAERRRGVIAASAGNHAQASRWRAARSASTR